MLATFKVVGEGVQGRRMLGHNQQEHQRQASQPAQGRAAAGGKHLTGWRCNAWEFGRGNHSATGKSRAAADYSQAAGPAVNGDPTPVCFSRCVRRLAAP